MAPLVNVKLERSTLAYSPGPLLPEIACQARSKEPLLLGATPDLMQQVIAYGHQLYGIGTGYTAFMQRPAQEVFHICLVHLRLHLL